MNAGEAENKGQAEGCEGLARFLSRVLVTGGSGFVGSAVVDRLHEAGCQVTATTTQAGLLDARRSSMVRWVRWDACSEHLPDVDWTALDAIIHLATPRGAFAFPGQAPALFEVNVAATFRLLEAARAHNLKRVLVASTGDVLGGSPSPHEEDEVLYAPDSFYGVSKACSELLAHAYQHVVSTAILRLYHPYGPGGDRFLVNRLLLRVAQGQEVTVEGESGILLNPVWIDDAASGICQAAVSSSTGVFHLGGPETVTLRRFLETAGEVAGRPPKIRSVPKPCTQRHACVFSRAKQLLGYKPGVMIREGLDRLWRQLNRQPGSQE